MIKKCHKICTACAATGYHPTVCKESQPVPGIKMKSYILSPFPSTLTFLRENHAKKLTCNSKLNKDKRYK